MLFIIYKVIYVKEKQIVLIWIVPCLESKVGNEKRRFSEVLIEIRIANGK